MPGRMRDPGPGGKDARLDEALRSEGSSTAKSGRIANAAAQSSRSDVGRRIGESGDYETWTVEDLRRRAAELGIDGRSTMRKAELVEALRAR